jgi:hypothetical protein
MAKLPDCIGSMLANERGSTAIFVALSMTLVMAGAAFGVETSYWYYKDMQLQAAADAAANAGALTKREGGDIDEAEVAGTKVAVDNGYDEANGSAEFNSPPASGSHVTAKAVEVILEENSRRFFSSIIMSTPVILRARAVATYEDAGSACVLALHTSASKAALFSGSSTSKFLGCSVMANSLADNAVTIQGTGKLETSCIYSVGGVSTTTTGLKLDDCKSTQIGVSPVGDPYEDVKTPEVTTPCQSTSGSTLSPGTYCSGLSLSGTTTLSSGTYVIEGGDFKVNANAKISGSGVTIYLKGDSRVSMNGTATVKLSAPTSGDYSGMLFYGDRDNSGTTKNIFNGTADSLLTGAIYFANQAVQFNGDFSGDDGCTQIVGLTVEWNGNANIKKDCTDYGMKAIPAAQLVKLVE